MPHYCIIVILVQLETEEGNTSDVNVKMTYFYNKIMEMKIFVHFAKILPKQNNIDITVGNYIIVNFNIELMILIVYFA